VCSLVRQRFIPLCFCFLTSEHVLDVNAFTNPPSGGAEVPRSLYDIVYDAGGLDTESDMARFLRHHGCRPTHSSFVATRAQYNAAIEDQQRRGGTGASASGGASGSASSAPAASSDATQERLNLQPRRRRRQLTPG
jgi:hypothetical protein